MKGTCDLCGGIVPLAELDTWDGQRLCEACYPPECDCPGGSPCKAEQPALLHPTTEAEPTAQSGEQLTPPRDAG